MALYPVSIIDRQIQCFLLSGETSGQGGGGSVEGDHQGAFEAGDHDGAVEDFQEGGLGFFGQFAIGRVGLGVQLANFFFDESAEGLDEVVGEGEGVVAVSVVDAEGGQESCAAKSAGHGGAEDDVAVVEQGIGGRSLAMPAEGGVLQEGGPEPGGGLGLDVIGIAGADASAEGHQGPAGLGIAADQTGLMGDFGLDNLFPEAFFEGFACGDLLPEAFGLDGVGFEGQQEAGGQVFSIAGDDGGSLLEEDGQDGMGAGDGRVVDEQNADVLTGDLAFELAVLPNEQLSQMDR